MIKQIKLISALSTVGSWTLASRVLGFLRDILIAAFLGAGPIAEAFLIAFSLPNMFRRFFAEGAFSMAFIPLFSKKLTDKNKAREFANNSFNALGLILIIVTIIAQAFMPLLVYLMASGFVADERFDVSVLYARIAFPYILFISLAALLSGVLNSTGRFTAAAAAPVTLNIIFIFALIMASKLGWDIGLTLACSVPLAGLAQLILVWKAASLSGFRLVPRIPNFNPDLRRLLIIAGPAALAGGVVQVNLLVGRQIASYFDGAIAWLSYADRLYQLPLGVVGIAIGVVLLPDLSRKLQLNDQRGVQDAFNRAYEIAMVFTIPSAIALVIIPNTLVGILFERGLFDSFDTTRTAAAVLVYALGLPAFVLQKLLQPVYFSHGNTKKPFYFAAISMVINVIIALSFIPYFGYLAPAIGTTIAGWSMAILLTYYAREYGDATKFDKKNYRSLPLIIMASLLMGVVIYLLDIFLSDALEQLNLKYLSLTIIIFGGVLSYAIIGQLLGAFNLRELKSSLKSQK